MKSQELCLFYKDGLNPWKRIYLTFRALLATWEEQPYKGTNPAVGWRVPMETGWALGVQPFSSMPSFLLGRQFQLSQQHLILSWQFHFAIH